MSLCMLAAAGGQDDILRLLIRKGVRVNARQKNGTTALMHAAEKVSVTQAGSGFTCSFDFCTIEKKYLYKPESARNRQLFPFLATRIS